MYRNVQRVIEANPQSWENIPAFETAVTQFEQLVTELTERLNNRRQVVIGATTNHIAAREALESEVYFIAKLIHAFAQSTQDLTLAEATKWTRSKLARQRMNNVIPLAEVMLEHAANFQPAIADFGVDQARIAALESAKNRFEIYIDAPRQAIVLRKTMTEEIDTTVRKVDDVLKKQLDALIFIVKTTDPTFFSNYFNARNVIENNRKAKTTEDATPDFFDDEIIPGDLDISPPEDNAA